MLEYGGMEKILIRSNLGRVHIPAILRSKGKHTKMNFYFIGNFDEYHGPVKLPLYKCRPDLVDFAALRVDLVDLAALLAEAGVAAVLVRF